ncbi:hypothetical protein Plhal304r1_c030g0097441 [Plasmopara halstedii]
MAVRAPATTVACKLTDESAAALSAALPNVKLTQLCELYDRI